LFDKIKFTRPQQYLNSDSKKEKAEAIRREACWRIRNNRQWKNYSSIYSHYRPHRIIQPAEFVLGRRFHPWRASYQRIFQSHLFSFLSTQLRNKWGKRKTTFFLPKSNLNNNSFQSSKKKNNFHNFQISIHLNSFVLYLEIF